ncbi:hypothetical protein [Flavobacterium coralii]|uniref:hypothetical protein n=1 Tax=Flavobacterium coralii TaxID=2838017 RepID=UPI000C5836E7|nr:hypothetical protein [Flavobacterium sp.]|tara:strand:+ start:73 stop:324 length:252 start_codon:yes stop_codon:yes gene_type:complete
MCEITGNIESIEYRNNAGHEKKVVTLLLGFGQKAFVEFRGSLIELLYGINEGDEITINITFEGKISKNSGIQYNNLVATSITK